MIILGSGGHAGVVMDALRSTGIEPAGMLDKGDEDCLTGSETLANGLGNKVTRHSNGLAARTALYRKFLHMGCTFPPVIHAFAIVSPDVSIGSGAQIMAGAIVQVGVHIGSNVIVNSRATIEHNCVVGDHCHVAPGAILCGGVTLGERVHVGAGAIVLQGRTIGKGAIIAAGAIVTKDVYEGECWERFMKLDDGKTART